MSEKIDIILLDNLNNAIQEINLVKPKSYEDLLIELKNKVNLPNNFMIFQQENNNQIIIDNNEKYQLIKEILFIREKKINNSYLEQSLFEINYNNLSESKQDILDEKYDCYICESIIKKEAPLFCYQCQKIYHEKCLGDWDKKMKLQNKELECPFCKYKLPLEKWNKKLNYEENRKNEAEIINKIKNYELNNNLNINVNKIKDQKINELKDENMNKNELNEKLVKNKEETLEIFNKIFNKIKIIQSLFKIEKEDNLNNIINNKEKNKHNLEINDLSKLIYEELEKIEQNIKNINKENQNKINELNDSINKLKNENEKLIEKLNENKKEIDLIYYTENEGINNILGQQFVENNINNIELIINGVKNTLIDKYNLEKGENVIKIIIKKKLII